MFPKLSYFFKIEHIESISPCQTPYEVRYFINLHNMVLKYDIHFNRMSSYIIHSFYVVMGSFPIYHECVAIFEKYMYQTDTIVGTYKFNIPHIIIISHAIDKLMPKCLFNLIQSDRSNDN